MKQLFKGAKVFCGNTFSQKDILVEDDIIVSISDSITDNSAVLFDISGCVVFPGFADVHVHLREPGFSYKETIKSGSMACARGGYTNVCTMPNLNPTPDCKENLNLQLEIIKRDAAINVHPIGTITKGELGQELSKMEEMADDVVGYSDDGRGVQSEDMMLCAMEKAKTLGKLIVAHCEDNSLLNGGYIHLGEYAKLNNHKGICSESEWGPIKRDIELVKKSGVKYHVCHISTKESVELIRKAKADGVDITCETGPHYLVMNDMMLKEEGRFKMNPPIRSEEDRLALVEGLKDGTIDCIATDHAPHSAEEKSKGLEKSAMGVVGIETAFPVVYTKLVKTGIVPLETVIKALTDNPKQRFKIGNSLEEGSPADFTVFDLEKEYEINPKDFLSQGKATPFENEMVYGECKMTVCSGKVVYKN